MRPPQYNREGRNTLGWGVGDQIWKERNDAPHFLHLSVITGRPCIPSNLSSPFNASLSPSLSISHMHFLDPVLNAADPRLHLCFIYLPVDEGRTDGRTEMRTRGEKDTLIIQPLRNGSASRARRRGSSRCRRVFRTSHGSDVLLPLPWTSSLAT